SRPGQTGWVLSAPASFSAPRPPLALSNAGCFLLPLWNAPLLWGLPDGMGSSGMGRGVYDSLAQSELLCMLGHTHTHAHTVGLVITYLPSVVLPTEQQNFPASTTL